LGISSVIVAFGGQCSDFCPKCIQLRVQRSDFRRQLFDDRRIAFSLSVEIAVAQQLALVRGENAVLAFEMAISSLPCALSITGTPSIATW
jgi:hypothetical protein